MVPLRSYICPSILNANLASLADECKRLLAQGADWLHLDVMDGHFVPNLSFGHPVVDSLRQSLGKDPYFDVHLMVSEPDKWIKPMAAAGANQFTFHLETCPPEDAAKVHDLIGKIRALNMQCGIAIKPGTSVQLLEPYASMIDTALIMTVEPGFGGQSFMEDQLEKVKFLRAKFPALNIQVDGGVGPKNIELCAQAGANAIVSGTAVVRSEDPTTVMKTMKQFVDNELQNGA